MLRELSVQNLALIEDVRVELQPGFCAWTGETGAGKSLLLGALGLLLGERGSADLIRAGADELRVTGRFELTRPELQRRRRERPRTGPRRGELILVARRLTRTGRSQAYVNDQPVSVGTLKQARRMLGRHPRPAREPFAAPAGLPAPAARRLRQAGRGCGPTYDEAADQVPRRSAGGSHDLSAKRERPAARTEPDPLRARGTGRRPPQSRRAGRTGPRARPADARPGPCRSSRPATAGRLYDDEGSVVERLGRLTEGGARLGRHRPGAGRRGPPASKRSSPRSAGPGRDLPRSGRALRGRPGPARRGREAAAALRRLEAKYRRPADDLIAYRDALDEQEAGPAARGRRPRRHRRPSWPAAFAEVKAAAAELSKARGKVGEEAGRRDAEAPRRPGHGRGQARRRLEPIPLGDDP